MLKANIVQVITEYEGNNFIYRIIDENNVTIRRVPKDSPLWSHGILCKTYSPDERTFIQNIQYGIPLKKITLDEALKIIEDDNQNNDERKV